MKKIAGLILIIALLSSCNLFQTPETEVQQPDLDQLLSNAQKTLAKQLFGFDVGITTALWLQQVKGVDGSALDRYNYVYTGDQSNTLWQNMYFTMRDLDSIIRVAQDTNARYYEAVAKIMMAITLGNLTDLFGDVPYSESFRLDSPRFDSQEYIYQQIFALLDDGINIINSGDPGDVPPGDGDNIYNWNMTLWKKAAYTLKARYKMHLTQVYDIDYNEVLSYLDQGLSSNDEDMRYYFYLYGEQNPIYSYITDKNELGNAAFIGEIILDYQDPRYRVLAFDGYWARQEAYFPFVQYTEALFLKSEAYWRLNDTSNAKESLKSAVTASFEKYLVTNASDWLNNYYAYVDTLPFDTLIYEIATQKYLDLVYHPEAYNDWRRLDYPQVPAVTGDSIPLRFPYSQQEIDQNPNVPTDVSIYDPVWWDK